MSSMKGALVALTIASGVLGFAGVASAGVTQGATIDPAVASTADQPRLDKAAWCNGWGCHPGWGGHPGWRYYGPRWGYHPYGWAAPIYGPPPPVVGGYLVCPPGYHLGPYRRACWPN